MFTTETISSNSGRSLEVRVDNVSERFSDEIRTRQDSLARRLEGRQQKDPFGHRNEIPGERANRQQGGSTALSALSFIIVARLSKQLQGDYGRSPACLRHHHTLLRYFSAHSFAARSCGSSDSCFTHCCVILSLTDSRLHRTQLNCFTTHDFADLSHLASLDCLYLHHTQIHLTWLHCFPAALLHQMHLLHYLLHGITASPLTALPPLYGLSHCFIRRAQTRARCFMFASSSNCFI